MWASCCQEQNTGNDAHGYTQIQIIEADKMAFSKVADDEAAAGGDAPRLLGQRRLVSGLKEAKPSDLQPFASFLAEALPEAGVASLALAGAKTSLRWWFQPEGMDFQNAEAVRLVAKFCSMQSLGAPVEPTADELELLWCRCEGLDLSLMSAALADQLTPAGGRANSWQPCFRALCVLEHWYAKGGAAKEAAEGVHAVAGSMLSSLFSQVPECRFKVLQLVLAKLRADGCSSKARQLEVMLEALGSF